MRFYSMPIILPAGLTSHFLIVSSRAINYLPFCRCMHLIYIFEGNFLYVIGKYTRSFCATGPTCHIHKKYTYISFSGTQEMNIKSDDIPKIFPIFFTLRSGIRKDSGMAGSPSS
jgi:hypothetical protein